MRGAVLVCALAMTGCYRTTASNPGQSPADVHTATGHLFVYGIVGEVEIDVRDYCGDRPVAELRTSGNALTLLATIATFGVYSPRRVRVVCAAGEEP